MPAARELTELGVPQPDERGRPQRGLAAARAMALLAPERGAHVTGIDPAERLRREAIRIYEAANESDDGYQVTSSYVIAVARRRVAGHA
jgi:hypothetical protein